MMIAWFKGKRKDTGEWVEGYRVKDFIVGVVVDSTEEYVELEYWWPCHEETICQYSGIEDKNGVKIFEGDRITSTEYPFESDGLKNYEGEIYFWDEETMFYCSVEAISDRVSGRACGRSMAELDKSKIEIIGNIHDEIKG